MTIDWVNHASFVLRSGKTAVMTDPWLSGPAFNNGWSLTAESRFAPSDYDDVTHIWLSHEHPDHFSPRDLKAIPATVRARMTVLYQPTRDQKVVKFCRGLQFGAVVELPNGKWTTLGADLDVMCSRWTSGDSWIAFRGGGKTVLNLNDCVVALEEEVRKIRAAVGHVDVLMSQFSYANWSGNAGDKGAREEAAASKLQDLSLQTRCFAPAFVIPFASFIWFANSENFYFNDSVNNVAAAATAIEAEGKSVAVVLYPGATWKVGERIDWHGPAQTYAADFKRRIDGGPIYSPAAVEPDRLMKAAADYMRRIKRRNPALWLLPIPNAIVFLTDYGRVAELSLAHGLRYCEGVPDIATSSDNLLFALRYDWGADTLHVSGRFSVPERGSKERFFLFFRAAALNNTGQALTPAYFLQKLRNIGIAPFLRATFQVLGRGTRNSVDERR